jgi:hypothetical protein
MGCTKLLKDRQIGRTFAIIPIEEKPLKQHSTIRFDQCLGLIASVERKSVTAVTLFVVVQEEDGHGTSTVRRRGVCR